LRRLYVFAALVVAVVWLRRARSKARQSRTVLHTLERTVPERVECSRSSCEIEDEYDGDWAAVTLHTSEATLPERVPCNRSSCEIEDEYAVDWAAVTLRTSAPKFPERVESNRSSCKIEDEYAGNWAAVAPAAMGAGAPTEVESGSALSTAPSTPRCFPRDHGAAKAQLDEAAVLLAVGQARKGPARRLDARGPRRRSAAPPVVPALNQRRPLTVDLSTVGPGKPSLVEADVDRAQALPAEKSTFTTALDTTLMLSLRDSLSERICHMILSD
jgi:hypothetical protein